MTVLVTGATGHLGNALVRLLLSQGRAVRALVRDEPRRLPPEVQRFHGDVRDPGAVRRAVEGVAVVHHLAAVISLVPWDFPKMKAVNEGGTRNVAQACRDARVRMVHYSSVHAFRPDTTEALVDETRGYALDPSHPAYDRSKALGSLAVDRLVSEGLDAVTLHPTGVLGPFDPGTSNQGAWLRRVAAGRELALVRASFDWVDVRDVVALGVTAEDPSRAPTGEHYLVGSRHGTMEELARYACEAAGTQPPRGVLPLWCAELAAPFGELASRVTGLRLPVTRAAVHALKTHRRISHEKASRCLGLAPRPLEETVRDAVRWYRDEGMLR
ncbi:MAG: NAD-dependent epimerase/dehydratase family protein [Deltaproteobacteria bacterium]|nr:NAD-dependent epimerase/dehydratase family protein [Deltaproteobacteria bacterium]